MTLVNVATSRHLLSGPALPSTMRYHWIIHDMNQHEETNRNHWLNPHCGGEKTPTLCFGQISIVVANSNLFVD